MLPRPNGHGDDNLGVIVSLAVAFGMIVGALAALWIAGGGTEMVARWFPYGGVLDAGSTSMDLGRQDRH